MDCLISPFCNNDLGSSVPLLQAKTGTSGGWGPCGLCREGRPAWKFPLAHVWGNEDSLGQSLLFFRLGLSSSSQRAPQNTSTGALDSAHKHIQTTHSKIPNVCACFFNHLISLRSQFGLNISKASFKTAVQCFGVFCSGPWSICPPLDVETPLPF